MGNAAGAGIITILLAFPLYLLWKGELPTYLALARTNGAPPAPTSNAGGNGQINPNVPAGVNAAPGLNLSSLAPLSLAAFA